jgi:predicted nucleotidyltransferase
VRERVVNPSIESALRRFSIAVRERFAARVRTLCLFGSYARGEAHEESDVDVLVVIDDLTDDERREVLDLAYSVDASAEWVGLAPLVFPTALADDMRKRERRLMLDIAREGIAL